MFSFRELSDKVQMNDFSEVTDIGKDLPTLYKVAPLLLDKKTAVEFLVWRNVLKPDQVCPECGGKSMEKTCFQTENLLLLFLQMYNLGGWLVSGFKIEMS